MRATTIAGVKPRVLDLRDNLTAYDAFDVALAETLGLPLLTRDAKFARGAGHKARRPAPPSIRGRSGHAYALLERR